MNPEWERLGNTAAVDLGLVGEGSRNRSICFKIYLMGHADVYGKDLFLS